MLRRQHVRRRRRRRRQRLRGVGRDPADPTGKNKSTDFRVASGLVCNGGTCAACGGPGQPCCDGSTGNGGCGDGNTGRCVADGGACSAAQGTCTGGGCKAGACGKIGETCCAGGVGCTSPFSVCTGTGICAPCGGNGERGCPGTHGQGFCGEPYACDDSSNRRAQCCEGAVCATGHTCNINNSCT